MPPLELSPLPTSAPPVESGTLPINPVAATPIVPLANPPQSAGLGFLGVFGSTFITIFLAELGDKTQFATLLLAAQSHNPGIVFAGAATALVATSLIGVLIGRWLCQKLSPPTLERATGIMLLLIAGGLMLDVIQL
jgi:putative Ca2+/H+ antiporter (TMEM165/GDT1 family)